MGFQPSDPTANDVYQYIVWFKIAHNGLAPTIREIVNATGATSTSVISSRLNELSENGRITFPLGRNVARAISLPGYRFTEAQ